MRFANGGLVIQFKPRAAHFGVVYNSPRIRRFVLESSRCRLNNGLSCFWLKDLVNVRLDA